MKAFVLSLLSFITLLFVACDESSLPFGAEVLPTQLSKLTSTTYFTVSKTQKADSTLSLNIGGYLGRVIDPNTQTITTCNFLTQFAISEYFKLPQKDLMVQDSLNEVEADSVVMQIFFQQTYGDSLTLLRLNIQQLDTLYALNENKNYYTNLKVEDYLNHSETAIQKSITFSLKDLTKSDSLSWTSLYYKSIRVKLPASYGKYLLNQYYKNPVNFTNPYYFTHKLCPGFYMNITDGVGAMLKVDYSTLNIYFRYKKQKEATYETGVASFANTPEVIQLNQVTQQNLTTEAPQEGFTMLQTPSALYTEVALPLDSIFAQHHSDSIKGGTLIFNCLYQNNREAYAYPTPTYVLLLQKSKLKSFFEKRELPDQQTSFLGVYDAVNNVYVFNNVSDLLSKLRIEAKGNLTSTQAKTQTELFNMYHSYGLNNPDWNKLALIPIQPIYDQKEKEASLIKILPQNALTQVQIAQNPTLFVLTKE